ncbi:MAG TPA: xanthine dehydrogenase family protein molybdopterin-binding subunit [Alphaproteobacteria bacterium]|nr:xanthine dehydrogenase family protein molybdopterin-binding subunit [Alphaproteobacteria bacterium]
MGQFGIGQAVRRTEDQRFVRGRGQYTDDIALPRQTYAIFVRSPHAHAVLRRIDKAAAEATPGVLAVYTGAELKAAGMAPIDCGTPVKNIDGSTEKVVPWHPLAVDRVRHVGDPVAVVVGATVAAARDGAERVEVDYEPLPAVTDTAGALAPGAPRVWDEIPNNLSFDWEAGNKAGVEAAFAKAARVVKLDLINNRVVQNPMEGRAAIGDYDQRGDRYVLYTSTQGSHGLRRQLCSGPFKLPDHAFRVITPDVGGGFGMKNFLHPEQAVVPWLAKELGRPVKWTAERTEGFLTDVQGRDHVSHAELALDGDSRILALRVETIANLGAYLSYFAPFVATAAGVPMLPGVYAIPAVHVRVKGVLTNTAPVDAYRGAGRPEASYLIERIVDVAARETGLGPAEFRKRNFIPPSAMPYKTAMGLLYDSGDFARLMTRAMQVADWQGFEARRKEARKRGKLRGLGMAYYVERCGGGLEERAELRINPAGEVTVLIGTQSNGQGHETAYAQIVEDKLGIPFEKVRVVQGDTDVIATGRGTGGSRSLPVGGNAVVVAADHVIAKGKRIAADMLEAAEADIEFKDGVFAIAGTDRKVAILDVIKRAYTAQGLPKGMEPGIDEIGHFLPANPTYPNGCHIVELEIDQETGTPEILAYVVVDDFGRVINPLLIAGQVHGGVVQGVGQALYEHCVYDPESGQLLSGSFMDYTMPRADHMPPIAFETVEILCTTNPLGIKGSGEAGAIGAPPAVINAVVDALAEFGVRHVDMPATAHALWRVLRQAKAA